MTLMHKIAEQQQTSTPINPEAIYELVADGMQAVSDFSLTVKDGELMVYRHNSFWACMDTFKEKQMFDAMYARGETPWAVWKSSRAVDTN